MRISARGLLFAVTDVIRRGRVFDVGDVLSLVSTEMGNRFVMSLLPEFGCVTV
jgi:hypothetical protein